MKLRALFLAAGFFVAWVLPAAAERIVHTVPPNEADPSVTRFLLNSIVIFERPASAPAPMLVFLPGTGADPARLQVFLGVAVDVGYRAIALSYDNEPAVMQVCSRQPDPSCSENFRSSRLFGGTDTPPQESIVARLTKLLQFLDFRYPEEGWREYLTDGAPDWQRIAVAGHSQGGGMAALLAKRMAVARVMLLSGPPDWIMPGRDPAPWLGAPGATPSDRWYGLYHRDEQLAAALQRAYAALGLTPSNIRVVSLTPGAEVTGPVDAYHVSVVADRFTPKAADGSPSYATDWRFLLGPSR
jgi:predicted esterase